MKILMIKRKKTKEIQVGKIKIGGNNPIRIQSMCNTKSKDINATVKQIHSLEEAGCEITRIAIPDIESAKNVKEIKQQINIPQEATDGNTVAFGTFGQGDGTYANVITADTE